MPNIRRRNYNGYNGYNGIICLRIVAAMHCCTVKCSTTSVHHAHRCILLLSSNVFGSTDSNPLCISRFGLPIHLHIYTYSSIHINCACAMYVKKCCIFHSYAKPITRLHIQRQMKWMRCKIDWFVNSYDSSSINATRQRDGCTR